MSDNNNTPNGFDVFSMFCGIIVIGVIVIKLLLIHAVMGIFFGLGSWYCFNDFKEAEKKSDAFPALIFAVVLGLLAVGFITH
jgi:hypothetical protein